MSKQLELLDLGLSISLVLREAKPLSESEVSVMLAFMKESLDIKESKTKRLFVIAMIGLAGSGKSSVAQALSEEIGATIVSYDKIRWELRKQNVGDKALGAIARGVTRWLTQQGSNVILDADFIEAEARRDLRDKIRQKDASVVFVRTYADLDVIITRLKQKPDAKISEMANMLFKHYRVVGTKGRKRLVPRELSRILLLTSDIDTTKSEDWQRKVKVFAQELLSS
ncbi:MAG: ATP-binding protein [Patescibacteria group bacterium]